MTLSHLAQMVASAPWAIHEPMLWTILEIANREHGGDVVAAVARLEERLARFDHAPPVGALEAVLDGELEAVAMRDGRRVDTLRRASLRGSVAVVPIVGSVFRYANLFTSVSGATSLQVVATDFQQALDDPSIDAVLLSIDSPGGQASGIGEFADAVFAARGVKPIWAYVSDMGASAAYWIASAADRVVVAPAAMLGSIGVLASYTDTSQRDAAQGVKQVRIVSSQSPRKALDPSSPEGYQAAQDVADQIAALFVASVARNRGVTPGDVLQDFGQGGLLIGQAAVDAGLADAVGSFEGTLAGLAATRPQAPVRPAVRADQSTRGGNTMTGINRAALSAAVAAMALTDLRAMAPTQVATIEAEALDAHRAAIADGAVLGARAGIVLEAATAERDRILGIQAHGARVPGHVDLVAKLIADPAMTPDRAAGVILAAEGAKGGRELERLRGDETATRHATTAPVVGAIDGAGAKPWADATQPLEARAKALFDASPDVRKRHTSVETLVEYERRCAAGQVKIHGVANPSEFAAA